MKQLLPCLCLFSYPNLITSLMHRNALATWLATYTREQIHEATLQPNACTLKIVCNFTTASLKASQINSKTQDHIHILRRTWQMRRAAMFCIDRTHPGGDYFVTLGTFILPRTFFSVCSFRAGSTCDRWRSHYISE